MVFHASTVVQLRVATVAYVRCAMFRASNADLMYQAMLVIIILKTCFVCRDYEMLLLLTRMVDLEKSKTMSRAFC